MPLMASPKKGEAVAKRLMRWYCCFPHWGKCPAGAIGGDRSPLQCVILSVSEGSEKARGRFFASLRMTGRGNGGRSKLLPCKRKPSLCARRGALKIHESVIPSQ